jgi:hypothetical protein
VPAEAKEAQENKKLIEARERKEVHEANESKEIKTTLHKLIYCP